MDKVLGIIFAYSDRDSLRELVKIRTLSSLPIAGKYRIIDFPLSQFVNSNIYDVAVLPNNNYQSLIDHIGAGTDWDLMRKKGGLKILPPLAYDDNTLISLYRGTADAIARNLHFLKDSRADYVIITGTAMFCSGLDLKDLLRAHKERGDDITAVYTRRINGSKKVPAGVAVLHMNDENIRDIHYNLDPVSEQDIAWAVETFVIRKSLLETITADAVSRGEYDWYEGIIKKLSGVLKIRGYEYKGPMFEVKDVAGYMWANMNFLKDEYREKIFEKPVFTKVKDSVPAVYTEGCDVRHSLISDGCRIEGTVVNSVISRGVKIGKGSVVEHSIVMQDTEIMPNVTLKNAILDKDVIVRENRQVIGHESYPVVVAKGSIV